MPRGVYLRKNKTVSSNRHGPREMLPQVVEVKPNVTKPEETDERNQLRAEVRRLEKLVTRMAEKLLLL